MYKQMTQTLSESEIFIAQLLEDVSFLPVLELKKTERKEETEVEVKKETGKSKFIPYSSVY